MCWSVVSASAQMMRSITNDVHHVAAGATFTYQSARSTSCRNISGGTCTTASVTATVGDLLVQSSWVWDGSPGTNTFSDSLSNTWTTINSGGTPVVFQGGGKGAWIARYTIVTNGGTDTFTCTGTGAGVDYTDCLIDAFTSSSGWAGTPLDQSTVSANLGVACSASVGPTTQAVELAYGSCSATAPTAPGGWTQAQLFDGNSTLTMYQSLSATGTVSYTVGGGTASPSAWLLATFKPN